MPLLHTGQPAPLGHASDSSLSLVEVQPGSFGKSAMPSPSLSRPSLQAAGRHVREPGVPAQVNPAPQTNAPLCASGTSQLPPFWITPLTVSVVVPVPVPQPSTT